MDSAKRQSVDGANGRTLELSVRRGQFVDGTGLLLALSSLQDSDAEGRRTMNAEWRSVESWLRREAGTKEDAGEACQYAMMRVSRGIAGLRAETPAQAMCWLRCVLRTGFSDVYRFANNEPVASALSKLSPKARDRELRRLEAPAAVPFYDCCDPGALDGFFDTLLDHVDEWLEANVTRPMKRAGDRRRAEVALLHHVRKVSLDELRDMLGEAPSRDTLYKWFERGRDEVLLPTLEAWGARAELEDEEVAFVTTLQIILIATRREKSRKPRIVRRGVSRAVSDTSVQWMTDHDPTRDREGWQ